jgi:hypothetical protein
MRLTSLIKDPPVNHLTWYGIKYPDGRIDWAAEVTEPVVFVATLGTSVRCDGTTVSSNSQIGIAEANTRYLKRLVDNHVDVSEEDSQRQLLKVVTRRVFVIVDQQVVEQEVHHG